MVGKRVSRGILSRIVLRSKVTLWSAVEIHYNQHILQAEGPVGISRTVLIIAFRIVHVWIYLQRGEDAGERSSEQEEDRDGRQLARVSVPEVRGCLYQLRGTPIGIIFRCLLNLNETSSPLSSVLSRLKRAKDVSSPTLLTAIVGMLEACMKVTTEIGVTGDRRRPNRPKYTTRSKKPARGTEDGSSYSWTIVQVEPKENLLKMPFS